MLVGRVFFQLCIYISTLKNVDWDIFSLTMYVDKKPCEKIILKIKQKYNKLIRDLRVAEIDVEQFLLSPLF